MSINDCMDFLRKNQHKIEKIFQPTDPELKKLRDLCEEARVCDSTMAIITSNRTVFFVVFEADERIVPKVMENYLSKAVKHFYKYDKDFPFSGVRAPSFHIRELPIKKQDFLREIISNIKWSTDLHNSFFNKIDV